MSHEKRTYCVVAKQIGWKADIEARDVRKAVNRACEILGETLSGEFVSRHPLTVAAVSGDFRLYAKNLWRRADGVIKSRPIAEFRVD